MTTPRFAQPAITAFASAASGAFEPSGRTISIAIIAPRPRTSPTWGCTDASSPSRAAIVAPIARARPARSPVRIRSIAASAAAQEIGLPPNVPPSPPATGASMISARPVSAASGRPPPSAFAVVTRSGTIPSCSLANQAPVRQKPVCTSSAMNTTPCSAHQSESSFRKPGAGTMKPPSPWIGSTRTAATCSSPTCTCTCAANSANASSAQCSGPVGQR